MYLHLNLILQKNLNFLTNQIPEGFKKQFVFLFLFSFVFAALLLISQITLSGRVLEDPGILIFLFSAICEALGLFRVMNRMISGVVSHMEASLLECDPCSQEDNHYIVKFQVVSLQ